ncbi:Homocysteine S-methyltransferase [Planctomycetes bacterium Pan216]|uniref:S-methylmethionine:homocysteine methyltransferase n=2 Tax=Kolteria novifilia TaxID=2527975 RepID=A0A518B028_9BACT|nr:Homocysteine S-methyltransferase [Planctomycetes bacterium Pan216]
MSSHDLLTERLNEKGYLLLDGGLATELERRGFDVNDPLWSARVLLEEPHAIEALHFDYLQAGADCLITSSYQASFAGFAKRGLSREEAIAVMKRSYAVAFRGRAMHLIRSGIRGAECRPVIAASIGPYGATLHDGSEYRGDYGLSREELIDFHHERMEALAETDADLFACETIPSLLEAEALGELLAEVARPPAWVCFSCKDGRHLCHGEPIREAAALLDGVAAVVAIGVNCTAPRHLESLIGEIRAATEKPIVVYPNSGETWDAKRRCWVGTSDPGEFARAAERWFQAGARIIGGCCRTGPEHIAALHERLGRSKV